MKFVYVSGAGADSSGKSSQMWARVRGEVENKLLMLFPGHAAIFRPAFILPTPEVQSRTPAYRLYIPWLPRHAPYQRHYRKAIFIYYRHWQRDAEHHAFWRGKTVMTKPDIVACADRHR